MLRSIPFCSVYLLLSVPLLAHGADTDQPLQQVTVAGNKLDERRLSTTTGIVVGRDEIVRHGDVSLADVLKRQPGITIDGAPGKGGEIRMRGLGSGYTLILLNGMPVAAGFSLDSLAPELIERIEIQRAANAETGGQAIAGSINVVLRKIPARAGGELKGGLSSSNGRPSSNLAGTWSTRAGGLSYGGTLTLADNRLLTPSLIEENGSDDIGRANLRRLSPQREIGHNQALELTPRIGWTLANGDTLAWQSYVGIKRIDNRHLSSETTLLGNPTDYPTNRTRYQHTNRQLRSDLNWVRKLEQGASYDVTLAVNGSWRNADFDFFGDDIDGRPTGWHHVDTGPSERGVALKGRYRLPLGKQHALAIGWDGGRQQRREFRREYGYDGAVPLSSDVSYRATLDRLALYAQDEWELAAGWSLYLGLRWEGLHTQSDAVDQRSSVWSPLLQSLWKLSTRQQLRLAVTRTYKAPTPYQLIPRVQTSDNNNSATNPDQQGNPGLRPELAWGLDGGYEFYPAAGGLLSASVFLRRISDVTLERLFLSDGRWITTPDNMGQASTRGIELEAKLPLGKQVELRANLTRSWSRLEQVPGPDNRLGRQVPLSANLGLDYRLAALTLGGNLTYQGGARSRSALYLSDIVGVKRELDLYSLWQLDGKTRLRLAGANLLRQDQFESATYTDRNGALQRSVLTPTYATFRITLERQF